MPESTVAAAQNLLWKCGSRRVDLRRVAGWAVDFSHKEADVWAGRGVKGREEELIDTANVVRSEVAGLCVFFFGWQLWARRLWCWDPDSSLHASFGMGHHSQKVRTGAQPEFPRRRIGMCHAVKSLIQWVDKCSSER